MTGDRFGAICNSRKALKERILGDDHITVLRKCISIFYFPVAGVASPVAWYPLQEVAMQGANDHPPTSLHEAAD